MVLTPPSSQEQEEQLPDTTGVYMSVTKSIKIGFHSLLLFAKIVVENPTNPQRKMVCHAFLDSGSEQTFILPHIKQYLELPTNYSQVLRVLTFGSSKLKFLDSEHVNISIQLTDQTVLTVGAHSFAKVFHKMQKKALTTEDLQFL